MSINIEHINNDLENNKYNYSVDKIIKIKNIDKIDNIHINNEDIKTEFYWNNLNQNYKVNNEKKYCILFNGCFCPPHKGHINAIKEVMKIFNNNCKIIINQLAYTNRHGIPKDFSKFLLEKYIKVVFNSNPNIKILFRAQNKEMFFNEFVLNSDILVVIKGDEFDENNIKINQKYINKYSKIIKYLNKKNIKVDFIFQSRIHDEISATKFISNIINYKKKYNNDIEYEKNIFEIFFMIPDEINLKDKYIILKEILDFNIYNIS
jgi:glycerol-3-phosphate cytidylyltransferase-like family protein